MDPEHELATRELQDRTIDGDLPPHDLDEPIPFGPGWSDSTVDLFNALVDAGLSREDASRQVDATFMTPQQFAEEWGGLFC